MFSKSKYRIRKFYIVLFFSSIPLLGDSFYFNTYNNHGIVGLINTPTARFYDEGVHGVTVYGSDTDQKITLTSNPYDWFEASFFYMNTEKEQTCRQYFDSKVYCQGYKDKGFNIKLRLKEEGVLPAVAIGLMDFAGTGIYSSEYIVSSYGIGKIDMHLGLGWGLLSGSSKQINNPLGKLRESFYDRSGGYSGEGGQLNLSKYFSGENAAPFYGISYSLNDKTLIKFEKDTILDIEGASLLYPERKSDFSFGIDYTINDNFSVGISHERGGYSSIRFIYKNNPQRSAKKYRYQKAETSANDDKYTKLIKNLEENEIGVNKITETAGSIGLDLTQFIHPDLNIIEEIIAQSASDAGINKNIKKDLRISDLKAVSEIDEAFQWSA